MEGFEDVVEPVEHHPLVGDAAPEHDMLQPPARVELAAVGEVPPLAGQAAVERGLGVDAVPLDLDDKCRPAGGVVERRTADLQILLCNSLQSNRPHRPDGTRWTWRGHGLTSVPTFGQQVDLYAA